MKATKKIRLMTLSPLGHTIELKEIRELKSEELFKPGYAVLVGGRAVGSLFELVQSCRQAETEVIRLVSVTRGC